MERKKELKQQYKEMKPEMGVFIIRSKASNKCFLQATPISGVPSTVPNSN